MITVILFELDWQWWPFAALAFLYGLGVLVTVIAFLLKSAEAREKNRD